MSPSCTPLAHAIWSRHHSGVHGQHMLPDPSLQQDSVV
jgi:hypothetical protein